MNDLYKKVENNMNHLAENGVNWSLCASDEQILEARAGRPVLTLGMEKPVPADWIAGICGKKVLCLAGAGGLQGPILAASGAKVTILDLSERMLDNDRRMAEKHGLSMELIHGNMTDLSVFPDGSFDYVINPASLFYVPDVMPVFRECSRVLKTGGTLILAAPNPIAYVCDYVPDGGYYKAVNRMPYRSEDHPGQGDWVEFGHTMESYIGGQISCGFAITGYAEHQCEDITELYFMTRAVKLP